MSSTNEKSSETSTPGMTNGAQPGNLERQTTLTLTPEMFERMYLNPQNKVAGNLRKTFAVPTPLALLGLALSVSPLSCDLIGWRGAGGVGSASIGAYFFLGGLLMFTGGLLEFFLGNTYPFVLFCGYGGFWFTLGATLQPFYSAYGNYHVPGASDAGGMDTTGFTASFAFFLVFMCVYSFVMFICATRVNVALCCILLPLTISFGCLAAAFFALASGSAMAATLQLTGGSTLFVTSMSAWWLFTSLILDGIDFPIRIPTFDLSGIVKGHSELTMGKNVDGSMEGAA